MQAKLGYRIIIIPGEVIPFEDQAAHLLDLTLSRKEDDSFSIGCDAKLKTRMYLKTLLPGKLCIR